MDRVQVQKFSTRYPVSMMGVPETINEDSRGMTTAERTSNDNYSPCDTRMDFHVMSDVPSTLRSLQKPMLHEDNSRPQYNKYATKELPKKGPMKLPSVRMSQEM